jgi:hypothetical protein
MWIAHWKGKTPCEAITNKRDRELEESVGILGVLLDARIVCCLSALENYSTRDK